MPITFTYDAARDMLLTKAEGLVTFEDVQKHLDCEAGRRAMAYPELVDASDAQTNITPEEVKQMLWRATRRDAKRTLWPHGNRHQQRSRVWNGAHAGHTFGAARRPADRRIPNPGGSAGVAGGPCSAHDRAVVTAARRSRTRGFERGHAKMICNDSNAVRLGGAGAVPSGKTEERRAKRRAPGWSPRWKTRCRARRKSTPICWTNWNSR